MHPIPVDFDCHVCGRECPIAPDPPAKPVCEEHCPDHDYQYDKGRRMSACIHCDKPKPEDF